MHNAMRLFMLVLLCLSDLASGGPVPVTVAPDICNAPIVDTTGWQPLVFAGRLRLVIPSSLRRYTSVQAGLEFYHGGERWMERDLTVEWDVSHRAYERTFFDSLEHRLLSRDATPPQVAPCAPHFGAGWITQTTMGRARPRSIVVITMPPAPR